ncbi:SNF2-related protein [Legionella lytica]|uniref:SNF2-related protein n=1 Tax=Legionella lytica TaxID=96232 RepID=A0ABW8D2V4_9GAMM
MLNEALSKMPEAFEAKILLRGQEYFENGHVLNIRFSEGLLKGRVKGSSSQIYDVHMDLKAWPGKRASCTCTSHANCKHAAACLFALRAQTNMVSQPANKLDKRLDSWLKNLRAQEAAVVKTHESTHHLTYLIELRLDGYEHKVIVKLALAKLLKRGGYGKMITFNSLAESKKQHFIGDDNELVAQLLFKCGVSGWFDSLSIRNSELLVGILATGRAFFVHDQEHAIHLGETYNGTCQWVLAQNGSQNLLLMHDDEVVKPVLLDESWYFDYDLGVMGYLKTPYPIKQLGHLLEAPPISIEQAPLLAKKMEQTCPEFPVPQVFTVQETRQVTPTPMLILDAVSEEQEETSWFYDDEELNALFIARVFFNYNQSRIALNETCDTVVTQESGILIHYQRDKHFEAEKLNELHQILKLRTAKGWEKAQWDKTKEVDFVLEDIAQASDLEFLYSQAIPLLSHRGWQVEMVSSLYQQVVSADDVEWFSDLNEGSGTDFFSYQLGILVEGKSVSIVPLVADLIQHYKGGELDGLPDEQLVKLPLDDGRALQLEMGRIKPLVRLLLQFGLRHIDENHELQINKYQLILMQEAELALAATKSRWQGAEMLRDELKRLIKLTDIPEIPVPQGLQAQLRDYQRQGLSWIQFLRTSSFSGILADDMGLGKTIQTLTHLLYEKEQGRTRTATLIIAPTSLVGNWEAEARRFTPALKVLVYHGSERHQDSFDDYDLVISTYGLIHRDKEKFVSYPFYYLILDEAQFIKNARTKTTQIIQQLHAAHRLCLTGTPLENHLGELWSLFHFLMPGLLGDTKQFRLWFRNPIEKHADVHRRDVLVNRVKPFILRRTKNQVARELPPKTEMTRTIEIVGPQRDLYEAIRMSMEKKVRDAIVKQGLGKSHIIILDALLKLRQICCDPRLLSLPEAAIAHGTSAKLETLMELLDNLVEEGRRVLVFSQFTSMLQLIEDELRARNYDYLKLTGQTQNRQALVEQFQEGKTPVFLISLKAGGTGLNLTRADTVIHYDPWWNPAVEDQATDRTHRIGQVNPVFVYKLITSGTVEEAILGMQERKRLLVDGILSADPAKAISLSEEDIEQFFAPL